MTVFGPDWNDLSLDAIARFLANAPTEPLQWEAKEDWDSARIRKAVCGFANSHDGGYLILGAEKRGEAWELHGVRTPNRDPPSDVTDVLANGGVAPYPDGLDVLDFDVPDDRKVVVVYAPAISTPPCITGGTVFERVSGKTIPVVDPNRLASLFERGDAARRAAVAKAERTVARAESIAGVGLDVAEITLALAAPGFPLDLSSTLFSSDFYHFGRQQIEEVLDEERPPFAPRIDPSMTQFELVYTVASSDSRFGWNWLVCISREGAAAVNWKPRHSAASVRELLTGGQSPTVRAWQLASTMLERLGLGSTSSLALHARLPKPSNLDAFVARDGSTGPIDEAMRGIELELLRADGEIAFTDPPSS